MRGRRWIITLAWTIVGSLAATYAFTGATWHTPWQRVVQQTFVTMLFAGSCATLCVYGLPIVVPSARRRLPFPLDWLAIVATLVVFATIGSLAGAAAAIVLGFAGNQAFGAWYANSWKISLYFTMVFGLSGAVIQELRARLARTTLALRTKERDEADARRIAAEAQLASLEARVDPHFLFNTLNSIAALVRDNPAAAERTIEQLASLMRSSLDRRASSLVRLDEELATVRSYLEIERVRFGDRLRFHIDSAATAGAALVPRLALQTLTENSVKYAVSASREGATVTVRATAHNDRLRVSVEDDGPGFDSTSLPEGHGLQLLKSRLTMIFRDRAQFSIESRRGRTIVALDMPIETTPPAAAIEMPKNNPEQDRGCP
jgi:two-component sensor histidine kinase